ncbi:MAG: exo-alpha-sialidase [Desulfovibrionaceae bacterium]
MPSLDDRSDRHVVIDARPEHYCCFPDVLLADNGGLLCIYNEFDQHASTRRKTLLRASRDLGASWGEALVLNCLRGCHCPRLARLPGGELLALDDGSLYRSLDHGRTWAVQPRTGMQHNISSRPVALGGEALLLTAHAHRGEAAFPGLRHSPTEQMVYRSDNLGFAWRPFSVAAFERRLALCEGAVTRLADGRLLMLLRENTLVYEPMYAVLSRDDGRTWSEPRPTPLIGHRPTLGTTADGRLLVTYRDVGPDPGSAAWLGDLDELLHDQAVHGLAPDPGNPVLTPEGLRVANPAGPDAAVRYALRPLTDASRARAALRAEVRVDAAEERACAIRFGGVWVRLFPDRLELDPPAPTEAEAGTGAPRPLRRSWTPEVFHAVELFYEPGRVVLRVDGRRRAALDVDPDDPAVRPVLFGNADPRERNGGDHTWRALRLEIDEPGPGRRGVWAWTPADGPPDAWKQARVLELKNARAVAHWGHFGYSGWAELPDGRFFCAFHHADPEPPGADPQATKSHVRGAWFEADDFLLQHREQP